MKSFPIPVMAVGPGSEPEDMPLNYLSVAEDMAVFRMPATLEAAEPRALAEVRAVLARLIEAMQTLPFGTPRLDLTGLNAAALNLLNQTLGEGEVSVIVRAPRRLCIQETLFAGVWRVRETRAVGRIAADRLEACSIPAAVADAVRSCGVEDLELPPEPAGPDTERRTGLMNAPSLLAEIVERAGRWHVGQPPHVINLTLLPASPEDLDHMAQALGAGPVTILSRGYGNCRISSTRLANVWWVQYFNSMDKLILDTIEVVDVPEVALAAREDYEDSIGRLSEWLETLEEE
ncbi:MAG TPA: hydrogenase expression/formation protein [Rhodocyclaceae bacterium]|nr:MAG: hypothetical protein AUK49_00260 [Betaproteobacteria bacterium CG2_30_68_42]PIV76733.1 MAG: hydrogenase expression/formation protein [Rhodocyclales bacterium CG17_big_fil_post_rev_8_21_14_2_50_68_7]PIX74786.1 MAG: hydrogenase expression/formation protein [Rhodocyclales bacterium CG_4_10_14_3_um_filter_68_10]PJA57539.1 MAG: hydrogenase expression/formation protein [Rhodocyclales bacterium CG_4_9_14_3_um_filter_68_10]HCX33864.1 hydrogenase expression/formation protein [Rhodocyclaceae bact